MRVSCLSCYLLLVFIFIPACTTAIISPWSDLTVSKISAPLTAYPGYPYPINVTVENHGNATSGLISVGFYLSTDDHLTKNDTYIQVTTGDPLAPGASVQLSSLDTMPLSVSPGSYRLFAYVEDHEGDEKHLLDNTALLTAPVKVQSRTLPDTGVLRNETAQIIFSMTNNFRAANNVSPLVWDDDLARLAVNYSDRMVAQKFFSHTDPDGHDQSDRAAAAGYKAVKEIKGGERIGVAENIAYIGTGDVAGYGYVNPTDPESIAKGIMTGWIKSPGHRANILDPLASRIGVGLSYNGEYWYASQEFY
ncbi:MAG TPA: CAP domain-containing protein [Methanospirillum sp.]|uniref:CAP domain-containing protein n=1 Tax=Methanospirillum sp. TaxID=45200 RepID=UPI002C8CCB25|nr:CAP domain-containing protein [Methanospirillum sp.]HWQ64680.1 CAP domain-containing protein [Methanospirillum sp.]